MKFELEDYHRGITDEDLLADLRRVALELEKGSVKRTEYDGKGKFGATTQIRRFGSWFGALEKAGLQKTRTPKNLSEEELFQNLEELWIKLRRQPHYGDVQKPLSKFHIGTYENRVASNFRKVLKLLEALFKKPILKHTNTTRFVGNPYNTYIERVV